MRTVATAAPVRLTGIGHHFPGEPIGNDHFRSAGLGVDDAWIRERTGVSFRHWPEAGVHHTDMAVAALLPVLERAGLDPGDVDLIVGTSATARPRINPTTAGNAYMDVAMPVQREIGATNATCIDVTGVACAGFQAGSLVARGLLSTTSARTALVVCTENPRPILSLEHRNSTLFGGGAAVGLWERSEGRDDIESAVLTTDASYYDAFDISPRDTMIMKGKVVSDVAPDALSGACLDALSQAGCDLGDIDWVIPHQGNINIIDTMIDRLGLDRDKVLVNIDRRGNTSSVSVPSCLSEYVQDGTIGPGDRILTAAIGRGFTWGAMVFRYTGQLAERTAPAEREKESA